jgi:tetratricopeptide (TPR) repeat protein
MRMHRGDVPASLETIVLKCLAKNPDERYQSVLDLQRDLNKLNFRPVKRSKKRVWVFSAVAAVLVVGGGAAMWLRLNSLNTDDEIKLATVNDAGLIRERIAANKNNPAFSKHTLAALYCRLIDVDGEGHKDTLKDSLDAYKELVDPELKDVSFYTWYVASCCGYARFREHDFYQAARCERAALDIYERIPPDVRMLTPSLLEDINILLEECSSEHQVDQKNIHLQIVRAQKIWTQIESTADNKILKTYYSQSADIFHEMAERCKRGGDAADAITCYQQAAALYANVSDQKNKMVVEEACNALKGQLQSQAAAGAKGSFPIQSPSRSQLDLPEDVRKELNQASSKANFATGPVDRVKRSQEYYDLCQQYLPDTEETLHATCFLAYSFDYAKQFREALKTANEALAMRRRLGIVPNRDIFDVIPICFRGCVAEHDLTGAKAFEQQYFEVNKILYSTDPSRLAKAEMTMAYLWSVDHYVAEAIAGYSRAREILKSHGLTASEDYKGTVYMLNNLANVKASTNK